jgi:cell pole-organizing protein PopZ
VRGVAVRFGGRHAPVESGLASGAWNKAPWIGQGDLMSAVNSNSGDRDLEAIQRAQRAHEPSMEEILASIRNIIADERGPAKGPAPKPTQLTAAPLPQIVYSHDDAPPQGEASEPSQRQEVSGPTVVWRRPQQVELEPAPDKLQPNEEPLLSPEASEAAALSFGVLSADLAVRSAELADSMVRETLRPMLKQWLDENLPAIVERLVRAEIQRVARGGR